MTRLVLFDCDGTLADSQSSIGRAMDVAFVAAGLPPPGHRRTRAIVGLSLPQAIMTLAPELDIETQVKIGTGYRAAAQRIRLAESEDPLFAGADDAVRALAAREDVMLGMATGKSLKGVHRLIAHHDWHGLFATLQTADDNPSKPHPAMIERACAETGAETVTTVMVGDTTFDMEMARAAGVRAIGVSWGYHPVDALRAAGAHVIVDNFDALRRALFET